VTSKLYEGIIANLHAIYESDSFSHDDYISMEDSISDLIDEIERLARERDAAVADIKAKEYLCDVCANYVPQEYCHMCKSDLHEGWQWRGLQEGGSTE
jgi:hypothetical protein